MPNIGATTIFFKLIKRYIAANELALPSHAE